MPSRRFKPMRKPAAGLPRVPEKTVQAQVVQLLTSIGAKVYVLGTSRPKARPCRRCGAPSDRVDFSTRQTKGIGDVYALLPVRTLPRLDLFGDGGPRTFWMELWVEVKAVGGVQSPEQVEFQAQCEARGVPHVVGGVDEVIAHLVRGGWLKSDNVPHYRRPVE